jgi:hypothetical protein
VELERQKHRAHEVLAWIEANHHGYHSWTEVSPERASQVAALALFVVGLDRREGPGGPMRIEKLVAGPIVTVLADGKEVFRAICLDDDQARKWAAALLTQQSQGRVLLEYEGGWKVCDPRYDPGYPHYQAFPLT